MKIEIVGAGPAGLYFGLLMKKADPGHDITVYERNRPDDTFGFGVVFSDETLGGFIDYDTATYREIVDSFAYWDKIDIFFKGRRIRSGGHGFCGMSRRKLLDIFRRHCAAAGVDIRYETEIAGNVRERFPDADLILAADGINSVIRETYKEHFRPSLDWRRNKFVWLGSTLPLDAFTFIFRENEHGLFRVHAYQFEKARSTFIVECTEDTWRRAGLDEASEEDTIAYCEALFADDLQGHRLIANRSLWRTFPTVRNEHWSHENVVLMGDALHTAHFSIGSGTKLAMEDAIALFEAFRAHGDVAAALAVFEDGRKDEVARLQRTSETSLEWFEDTGRYMGLEPEQFAFSLLSRSKRVTYENLRLRDRGYVDDMDRWFAAQVAATGLAVPGGETPPPPMFMPYRLRGMELPNRVMMSPMCQYSATDGMPDDWHFVHLTSRAVGGTGLVYTEMTDVSPEGRISPGCTGIYTDAQAAAWKRIVNFIHGRIAAKVCMQLGHAGRKASTCLPWQDRGMDWPLPEGNWPILAPSPIPYRPESQVPKAMDRDDMDKALADYAAAAKRALRAGFDMLEVHMAHGYLLASFISPLTNRRDDAYGGSLENRMRFPLEVFDTVRALWPEERPMAVRISATDWIPGGIDGDDAVEIAAMLKAHGCDIIDVSSGQTDIAEEPVYGRMFQTPFADRIRHEVGIATIAVGNITTADQVNTILAAGRADIVALARPHLTDPYFVQRAAAHYGYEAQPWPGQYAAGRSQAMMMAERDNEEMAELRAAAAPRKPNEAVRVAV